MAYQHPGPPQDGRSAPQPGGPAVIVIGAVLAVLAMLLVIVIERRQAADDPGAARSWVAPPAAGPEELIPLQSDPPSPAPSLSGPPAAAATGGPLPVARPRRSTPVPSRVPAELLPEPGSRLSLAVPGTSGLRLQHQNFRMRLAAVGPRGGADATFVLRRGLADADCVSLESVNFPGRFVRHQNFALVLHPRESSALFAADATFCAVAAGTSGDFVLRSGNYPGRQVTTDGALVVLGEPAAGPGQRFHAGPGL